MKFKQVAGLWWPEYDRQCHPVVPRQVADLERALAYVNRWTVAVQAGGNAGVWPNAMAERFETVYTFEPDPLNFACLNRNVERENVIRMNCALGDTRDMVETFLPAREAWNAGAVQVRLGGRVPILPLDVFALPDCALLQLDIEGHEYPALRGAARILDKFRPVVMTEEKGLGGWPEDVIRTMLADFGYREVERIHRDRIYVAH